MTIGTPARPAPESLTGSVIDKSVRKSAAAASRAVYIGLGANLGDTRATLHAAVAAIKALPGVQQCMMSPLYRSAPIDAAGPDFVNAVVRLYTALEPLALLDALQEIERRHHRQRPYRNAPRTLDLDLLCIEGVTLNSERLIVPHPRMHERAFVLRPLADLAPDLRLARGAVQTLLTRCEDQPIEPLDAT